MCQRKIWSVQEDQALKTIILDKKILKWKEVAKQLQLNYNIQGRTGKQCRERWHNRLDPNIKTESWTHEEEQILFRVHNQFGNKWAKMTEFLQGRTDNSIKNHFYSTLRKSVRRLNKYINQNKSKGNFKEITNLMLYKLISVVEDRFENKHDVSEQLIDKCIKIKLKLLDYSNDIQINTLEQQLQIKNLITQILQFNRTYRKKKGKKKKQESDDSFLQQSILIKQVKPKKEKKSTSELKNNLNQSIQSLIIQSSVQPNFQSTLQTATNITNQSLLSTNIDKNITQPKVNPSKSLLSILKIQEDRPFVTQKIEQLQLKISPRKIKKNLIVSGNGFSNCKLPNEQFSHVIGEKQLNQKIPQIERFFPIMSFTNLNFDNIMFNSGNFQNVPYFFYNQAQQNTFSLDLSGKIANQKIMDPWGSDTYKDNQKN